MNNDEGYSVQQTTDGGYVIVGRTNSFGAGNYGVYLIKTNANGDTLWTKTIGGSNADDAYSVQQTTDGG
jgi:outer membrane protein assembly factor BamB